MRDVKTIRRGLLFLLHIYTKCPNYKRNSSQFKISVSAVSVCSGWFSVLEAIKPAREKHF